jgi:hypothetical protein
MSCRCPFRADCKTNANAGRMPEGAIICGKCFSFFVGDEDTLSRCDALYVALHAKADGGGVARHITGIRKKLVKLSKDPRAGPILFDFEQQEVSVSSR